MIRTGLCLRLSLIGVASVALVACGGGGGSPTAATPAGDAGAQSGTNSSPATNLGATPSSGANPPASTGGTPPPNATPVANAGASHSVLVGATVNLNGGASSDSDGDSLDFSWTLSRPTGSTATLTGATSASPGFVADVSGTYTAALIVSDGKSSSGASTVTVTVLPTDGLAIVVDKVEPLSGSVTLSLSGPTANADVTWYVGTQRVGIGRLVVWDTTGTVDADHIVSARIEVSPGRNVELRRSVSIANSRIALDATVRRTTVEMSWTVYVSASSVEGIARVSAQLDGGPAETLTRPNGCPSGPSCPVPFMYLFRIDGTPLRSGEHTMTIVAVDEKGGGRRISVSVQVIHAPVLTVSSPADGTFVRGSLTLAGSATTDTGGIVTVTASFEGTQFLETTAPSFGADFSLAGVAAGSHLLTIRAVDSGSNRTTTLERTVIVASSASMVHEPIATLGEGSYLLAVDGDVVLYEAPDDSVRLRDTATGTEVELQGVADLQYGGSNWTLAGSRAYADGYGMDCDNGDAVCVYQWLSNGSRRNLTADNPGAGPSRLVYQWHAVSRDNNVIWSNDGANSYTLFDETSGAFRLVMAHPEIERAGNWQYDFALDGGVVTFFYWGQTGPTFPGGPNGYPTARHDVYRWRSDTGASVRLSNPGAVSVYTQTDGARVAWSQRALDGDVSGPSALVAQPVAGGPATVLSSSMLDFALRDGVLAWLEPASASYVLRTSTTVTATVSVDAGRIYRVSGGHIVYSEAGKLYSWSSDTGDSTLLADAAPSVLWMSGVRLYFTMGAANALYRLDLE